jgi:hypothetical protein
MKKIIVMASLCLALCISANAQISKGQKMIGGELTFRQNNLEDPNQFSYDEIKQTSVTFTPQLSFGLGGNWIAGIGAGYSNQTTKYQSDPQELKLSADAFSVFLLARKFHPFNENIGIFGQLDIGGGFGTSKRTEVVPGSSATQKGDITLIATRLHPGFYFKVSKRLIIEANFGGLGYTSTTMKPEFGEKQKESELEFTLTSTLGIGFQVVLGKK